MSNIQMATNNDNWWGLIFANQQIIMIIKNKNKNNANRFASIILKKKKKTHSFSLFYRCVYMFVYLLNEIASPMLTN